MNALLANPQPLPSILVQRPEHPGRRHRIGDYDIDKGRLLDFNALLNRLDPSRDPLDCDRVATAARELCARSTQTATPPCIRLRMQRVAAAARMVADSAWHAAQDVVETASVVLAYVRGADDLIPDRLPRIGRLDDAIVVDAAWPVLDGEVADYADFRRLHRIEAALRGLDCHDFRFDRGDWEEARQAELALSLHRARVRTGSYLPPTVATFRVH